MKILLTMVRCGKDIRYIIDYYSYEEEGQDVYACNQPSREWGLPLCDECVLRDAW